MVNAAILATHSPLVYAAGTVVFALLLVCVQQPRAMLWLLGLSLVAGQLVRLPLPGQGGGVLVSDVAAVLTLAAAWWCHLRREKSHTPLVNLSLLGISPLLIWSLFTLAVNAPTLSYSALGIAGLYWIRLAVYLLLLPALLVLLRPASEYIALTRALTGSIVLIALLAITQLWLVPDLRILGGGWDPHIQRAVSTWLDPNFLGAFLVLGLVFMAARLSSAARPALLALTMVLVMAVVMLTKSRSTLAMLGATLLVGLPYVITVWPNGIRRHAPAILSAALLLALVSTFGFILLGERALGSITFDPTVQIRLDALASVWELVQSHGFVGVGYNAYQFAAREAGLIGTFEIHSRAGSDNSLLTLWVTTGVIGISLVLAAGLGLAMLLFRHWQQYRNPLSIAAIMGMAGLLVHSQLVNSLLYAHLLLAMMIVIALALRASAQPPKQVA